MLEVLTAHPAVTDAQWNGALHLHLRTLDDLPDLVATAVHEGARLTRVEPQAPTLETLYFEMQRQIRAENQRREETQAGRSHR